jgi:hypothetical protein
MTRTKGRSRITRPPKADAAIYAALSERFRLKKLYAYSYENGTWSTWETGHDFDATSRNGCYRCECAPDCGHGPTDWDRDELMAWLDIDQAPKVTRKRQPKVPADHQGGSEIVQALEAAYAKIREHHPELPAVVIITGSGLDSYGLRWGHFARDRWIDALANGRRPELFVGGERLACGAELTFQTMFHESAHALACVRGVQDCSRQNRYHNCRFLEIAREVGLDYPHGAPDPTIGYSAVELTDTARKHYRRTIDRLQRAVNLHLDNPLTGLGKGTAGTLGGHGGRVKGGSKRTRGTGGASLVKAVCACEPARIIRVSRTVLDGPAIRCDACEQEFAA